MSEPRRGAIRVALPSGPLTIRWVEWGPPEGEPVLCVHGLTRTGRDFDALAQALAARGRRVLCPDMPGRGESDWLADPALYALPTYLAACAGLAAALGRPFDWVGTSMGGLIGLGLAAGEERTRPRRMVLNDVGPLVPAGALRRIAAYLALDLSFPDMAGWEAHLRRIHAPFGPLPDGAWRHLAETSARMTAAGRLVPHYDPAIAHGFSAAAAEDLSLWELWERIALPVLVLRGAESDILPAEVAARMAEKPGVRVEAIPGVGHAPALLEAAEIALVSRFLAG
ncbi:MAG: alpha/beta hydrolase [Acetobacteraceae bacterium]|nr:alpha/beta hydrolase [Acetobacteraceae bacterium]